LNEQQALHDAVQTLRSPATIRARCGSIAAAVAAGHSRHFTLDRAGLSDAAARVATLT
jgi:hypothetical protein